MPSPYASVVTCKPETDENKDHLIGTSAPMYPHWMSLRRPHKQEAMIRTELLHYKCNTFLQHLKRTFFNILKEKIGL